MVNHLIMQMQNIEWKIIIKKRAKKVPANERREREGDRARKKTSNDSNAKEKPQSHIRKINP